MRVNGAGSDFRYCGHIYGLLCRCLGVVIVLTINDRMFVFVDGGGDVLVVVVVVSVVTTAVAGCLVSGVAVFD